MSNSKSSMAVTQKKIRPRKSIDGVVSSPTNNVPTLRKDPKLKIKPRYEEPEAT